MSKKFKKFARLGTNIIEHPKFLHNRLKKKKWIKLKNSLPRKTSEFGGLLLAKQRLKAFYGQIAERQLIINYRYTKKLKGNRGIHFLKLLENRLDTVLFRMRFSNTFSEIRQFITHKHILVNGKIVKTPSYLLQPGDIISVKEDSFPFIYESVDKTFINYLNISPSNEKFRNLDEYTNQFKLLFNPDFLEINYNTLEGIYIQHPDVSTLKYPFQIELQKIMQYYEYLRKI